jgi:hypothetical protein
MAHRGDSEHAACHGPTRPWGSTVIRAAAAALACSLLAGAAAAQPEVDSEPPSVRATPVAESPTLDGLLDDPVWQEAPVLTEFRQKEPWHGAEISEPTRVRIVHDRTHLYIGAELEDREPWLIRADELRRDNPLESDDTFSVLVDAYHDHRNAFLFRVNARGTRYDGVVRNESRTVDADWDEEWHARAAITQSGWSVEIAIPFKILRFRAADEQTWGLNFERIIKRKNELAYWAGWDRNYAFTHVSQAGHLVGLRDIRQAERFRLRPYVASGAERLDALAAPRATRGFADAGIDDLRFAITPNVTANLTVNPDFAQTEADAQRINLTRFSLFFPERRQFFVEGAESLRMGVDMMGFGSRALELVYTRTIGLSPAGEPIPLYGGGKLTGKVSGVELGLLNVQSDSTPGTASENFSVARARKEILGRSYVGGLLTSRQGGNTVNRVAGGDARFVLREHLTLTGLVAGSSDDGGGTRWATHAGTMWESDLLEAAASYVNVDPGFSPGVGFVRRHDRMLAGRLSVRPRPRSGIVRQVEFTGSAVYFDDRHGPSQSGEATVAAAIRFQSGERLFAKVDDEIERLPEPFEIHPGVVLAPGTYRFKRTEVSFETFNGRKWSGRAEANVGRFYTGTRGSYEFGLDYRPGKNFSLESDYELNTVHLAESSFTLHLLGIKSNVSFTPQLLTSTYLQYNTSGNLAAVQVRMNYIFRTIDNVYLVYNETRITRGLLANRSNRSLVAKMTYSLQR